MLSRRVITFVLVMIAIPALFIACASSASSKPKRCYLTLAQAFPASDPPDSPGPGKWKEDFDYGRRSFEASFEDVWTAVSSAASQAMLDVRTANKAKGVILAEDIKGEWFYKIVVKEEGAKKTVVQGYYRSHDGDLDPVTGWCDTPFKGKSMAKEIWIFTRNNLFAAGAM